MNRYGAAFDRGAKDGHTIRTNFNVYWSAVLDSYDGAPDAKGPNSRMGHGNTELEAIVSLLEALDVR